MKPICATLLAIAVLGAVLALSPGYAAPPTATPSPGYDARLQEQRAAAAATVYEPAVARPAVRHRGKRTHAH